MSAPLPKVPELGWFELEILYYLLDRERYGNEMRVLLNNHLGGDAVSTGKLYPVLKKLERGGSIRKLKKRTKERIDSEEGMTSRLLTRGVDRIYFEITDQGREQLRNSISFMTAMLYNIKMREVESRVRDRIFEVVRSAGEGPLVGVTLPNTERAIREAKELLPEIDPGRTIFFPIGSKEGRERPLKQEANDLEVNAFPSRYEDIPLKSNYLDAAVSLVRLSDVPGRARYLSELIRTIRARGKLVIVDHYPLDSAILGEVLTDHVDHEASGAYQAIDPNDLCDSLRPKLRDIELMRFRELFVISGTKPKKRAVHDGE